MASVSWFITFSFFFLYVFLPFFFLFFFAYEGFSDGGGVHGISSLHVLKAIIDKIGLSPKEAPIGTSKCPEVVAVLHFIFWAMVIEPRAASAAPPIANCASTKMRP